MVDCHTGASQMMLTAIWAQSPVAPCSSLFCHDVYSWRCIERIMTDSLRQLTVEPHVQCVSRYRRLHANTWIWCSHLQAISHSIIELSIQSHKYSWCANGSKKKTKKMVITVKRAKYVLHALDLMEIIQDGQMMTQSCKNREFLR